LALFAFVAGNQLRCHLIDPPGPAFAATLNRALSSTTARRSDQKAAEIHPVYRRSACRFGIEINAKLAELRSSSFYSTQLDNLNRLFEPQRDPSFDVQNGEFRQLAARQ
jgi:hypothetical protein